MKIELKSGISICYGHLFNCTGIHAERLAREFGVEHAFKAIPFKGLYWQIKARTPLRVPCNLYPVPDLNIPFLGIHFTPSADEIPTVSIGPTATPAFGAENYKGLEGIEPIAFANNLLTMTRMYAQNANGFRNYAHDQLLLALKSYMIKEARQLIPSLNSQDIEVCSKVGIRSQLFDKQSGTLHDDFVCISNKSSTHILNAISPAFTASFELADLIIDSSSLMN